MSIEANKIVNLEDAQILYNDLRGRIKNGISDTTGIGDTDYVWSADKTDKEVIRLDGTKANTDSVYAYKETSGSLIEIDDAVAEAVKQMRIEIAPVQDLHGYDHPWVGGAGKNLYDISQAGNSICTVSGNTATLVATTSFQASASVFAPVSTGDYKVSFTGSTGASLEVKMFKSDKSTSVGDTVRVTSSATITVSDSEVAYIRVLLSNGNSGEGTYTYNNVQVESGTTVTAYEPYSNICPISGWTGAKAHRYVKNLFDKNTATSGYVVTTSGSIVANANLGYSDYIRVDPSKTYYIQHGVGQNALDPGCAYNEHYNVIGGLGLTGSTGDTNGILSIPSGAVYIRFNMRISNYDVVQLEEGSTATTYDGSAKTYSITFPTSAGTVYGGTLTVNQDGTGSLLVESKEFILDGDETLTIGIGTPSVVAFGYTLGTYGTYINGKVICNQLVQGLVNSTNAEYGRINVINSNGYSADRANFAIYGVTTAAGMSEYLAQHNLQFIAYYQNPIPYQLTTDQVLHLLSGVNNVWSDCGVTTLLYPTDKYLTAEQAERERIHESITVPSPVQTIADGADNVPMEMTVGIEPVQDLHGYEYPWVGGAGKNLWGEGDVSGTQAVSVDFVLPAGTYTISAIPTSSDTDDTQCSVGILNVNTSLATAKLNRNARNGATITTNDSSTRLVFYASTTHSKSAGDTFSFTDIQIESGSSATSYAPYENICPITGHTGVDVTRTGKNLLGGNALRDGVQNAISAATNDETTRSIAFNATAAINGTFTDKVKFKPNTQYTIVFTYQNSATNPRSNMYVRYTDGTTGNITNPSAKDTKYTCVVVTEAGKTVAYVSKSNNSGRTTLYYDESGIFEGVLTAQDFEPYDGNTYSITFPSSAGTVYGGTLKVNKDGTGVLTVETVFHEFDGTESTSDIARVANPVIRLNSSTFGGLTINNTKSTDIHNAKIVESSMFKRSGVGAWASIDGQGLFGVISNTPWFSINNSFTDANDVISWFASMKNAGTPLQMCLELVTPVTYQLSAPIIRSLLGTNNVWADTGDILELNYAADTKLYISKELDASRKLMELIITANREDSMTATKAYTTGNLLIVNGTLYKATTSIANGATLTVGTNVTATTVAAEIAALS